MRLDAERTDGRAVERAVGGGALDHIDVLDAGFDVRQHDVVLDDAGAVHREAVVETTERLVLAPDDGADHRLGGGDMEDAAMRIGGVGFEGQLARLHLGERSHLDGLVARACPRAVGAGARRAERHEGDRGEEHTRRTADW